MVGAVLTSSNEEELKYMHQSRGKMSLEETSGTEREKSSG